MVYFLLVEIHTDDHASQIDVGAAGIHKHTAGALCVSHVLAVHHPGSKPEPAGPARVCGGCTCQGLVLLFSCVCVCCFCLN